MLVEFRVANFRSFREEQVLSLVAGGTGKDESHPDNLIEHDKFRLVKAAAVYGANASGKSNLIKAIAVMKAFIQDSATKMNQGDRIPGITPFRLGRDSSEEPSSFETMVVLDGTRYRYGFAATAERIHGEWLSAHPPAPSRRQAWFERRFDPETGQTTWAFRGPFKKADARILEEKTRDNGLVLSRGAELNIGPLKELFLWFRRDLSVLDMSTPPVDLIHKTGERIVDNPAFRDRVTHMIQHADLAIDRIVVTEEEVPAPMQVLFEGLKRALHSDPSRISADTKGAPEDHLRGLSVRTIHQLPDSGRQVKFDLQQDESNGTQRFFALAGPFLDALDKGAVLVVDELECSMHPLLTRKLLELFQSKEANKTGAQLVFATHDSTLMDPELFRRDQIWLVEKNSSGASELFSLYDFDSEDRPRSTTAFQRNYLAGRYGAVPKFGPIFEDLELE